MAESMKGLHRSHRCTEVSSANIGEKVTVMGWVQKRRNLGSLIFIDLRDRSGLLQIVFDEESVGAEGFAKAGTLRSEYVVAVEGTVQKRSAAVNENLKTGDIEVIATSLRILSESQTPPFAIEENSQTKEDIRLKYRYLDLRRPDIQKNLMLKSRGGPCPRARPTAPRARRPCRRMEPAKGGHGKNTWFDLLRPIEAYPRRRTRQRRRTRRRTAGRRLMTEPPYAGYASADRRRSKNKRRKKEKTP